MNLLLREQPPDFAAQYGVIPIAFEVRERLEVETIADGFAGVRFTRRPVQPTYIKDYDSLPGQRPADWPTRWDLTRWCLCAAFAGDQHVGGVAIVLDTAQFDGPRSDPAEAILWDLRVHPDHRNRGIGRQLLAFAEQRARASGTRRLSVETQDNNVPACRLYASAGYTLRSIDRFAYPLLPNEARLVWSMPLTGLRMPATQG